MLIVLVVIVVFKFFPMLYQHLAIGILYYANVAAVFEGCLHIETPASNDSFKERVDASSITGMNLSARRASVINVQGMKTRTRIRD